MTTIKRFRRIFTPLLLCLGLIAGLAACDATVLPNGTDDGIIESNGYVQETHKYCNTETGAPRTDVYTGNDGDNGPVDFRIRFGSAVTVTLVNGDANGDGDFTDPGEQPGIPEGVGVYSTGFTSGQPSVTTTVWEHGANPSTATPLAVLGPQSLPGCN